MKQGAREARAQYPMGAAAIERDFYMDDCLSGAETVADGRQLCEEMDTVLCSCGFELGKWRSSRPNVVPSSTESQSIEALDLNEFESTTVLGLRWHPETDELMFKFQPPQPLDAREATKRRVLSRIAQIFDPNGYVGPVVVVAKIFGAQMSDGTRWCRKGSIKNGSNFSNNYQCSRISGCHDG